MNLKAIYYYGPGEASHKRTVVVANTTSRMAPLILVGRERIVEGHNCNLTADQGSVGPAQKTSQTSKSVSLW